jgi:hypothetical protein
MPLIGLTLTACALPGASGPSGFISTMHPTQEFCASRGLTLDMDTKECGTAPQPAAPLQTPSAESATGSLPQATQATAQPQSASLSPAPSASSPPTAPVPATPQEHQRTALSVPVESDAKISPELQQDFDLMYEFAHFARASGYRCHSISALAPHPVSHGYEFVCNRFAYKYGIEHKNSRWIVTVE